MGKSAALRLPPLRMKCAGEGRGGGKSLSKCHSVQTPFEPPSNAGEFGAVVEDLSELATPYVFILTASEFRRPRTCRVTQGTRRRGSSGAAFPLVTFAWPRKGK